MEYARDVAKYVYIERERADNLCFTFFYANKKLSKCPKNADM